VDYIVIGTLETNIHASSKTTNNILFIQKTSTLAMNVKISAKLVNTTSGSVISAEEAEGTSETKSSSNEFQQGEDLKSLDVLFSQASKPALSKIASAFIPKAIAYFKPVMPKILVAAVDGGTLYLNAGENAGLVVGQQVMVVREGQPIIDPATGKILKVRQSKICEATISTVDPASAEATVPSGGPVVQIKDVVTLSSPAGQSPQAGQ